MPETFDKPTEETSPATYAAEEMGGQNDAQDQTDAEAGNAKPQSRGATVIDGGEEAGEVGEEAGPGEGETEGQEGDPEPGVEGEGEAETFDPNAFKEQLVNELQEKFAPRPAQSQVPQLTEEQWSAKEEEFGMNRRAIQKNISMISTVYDRLKQEFQEALDTRFAAIEKESIIGSMAKKPGFSDVARYKPGIEEFLGRYSPSLHKDPVLLETAYYYAKGKAANKNIQNVRKAGEVQRKIAGSARPAAPNGAPRKASQPLNKIERDVAARYGMSEAEYAKLKTGGKAFTF